MITIRLKEIAESKNLNMSQIQRQTGLTVGLVRRYWYNDTEEIKLAAINKLCGFLKVELSDLLEYTPD